MERLGFAETSVPFGGGNGVVGIVEYPWQIRITSADRDFRTDGVWPERIMKLRVPARRQEEKEQYSGRINFHQMETGQGHIGVATGTELQLSRE